MVNFLYLFRFPLRVWPGWAIILGALAIAVLVAQSRFSAIRSTVAAVVAFGQKWLVSRACFACGAAVCPLVSNRTWDALLVVVFGAFAVANAVAALALRCRFRGGRGRGGHCAGASSTRCGGRPETVFVCACHGTLPSGATMGSTVGIGAAMYFGGVWVGTKLSQYVPSGGGIAPAPRPRHARSPVTDSRLRRLGAQGTSQAAVVGQREGHLRHFDAR